ncbi:hypothetical protein [Nonomuraea typhae]|uniref:hypothetical protein n=1 Tax=Nonomuraea typhae TaxID=2603600 RepID=UPI0012F883B3|nr:hypothetical protein [Nonomuraea typhae]
MADEIAETSGPSSRVRLPGFVNDEDIGLGDVVKRVTRAAGFRPCRGCEERAATLNRWLRFSGRTRRPHRGGR